MLDAALILGDLVDAFPRSPVGANTSSVYARELGDIPLEALKRAVRHLIRSSTEPWLPTVGEIRRVVAEQALGLPDEQEALAQVDARIAWGRTQVGDAPPVDLVVREALELAGGYAALRQADNPGAARGSFLRHYRALRQHAISTVQVGRPELASGRRALEAR